MSAADSSAADASAAGTVLDDKASVLARTYGEALVNVAVQQGQVDDVLGELDAIEADVLSPHPKFAALLASPLVPAAEKDRVLVKVFEGRALPTLVRFLRVLNRHGRLGLIGPVARAARAIWDERQNRRPVLVRSAQPLDDAQQAALHECLARMLGATPILNLAVDPSLIGGLVVQAGDDVYDASVRNRLEQLRRRLIERKTHEIQSRRDHFSH